MSAHVHGGRLLARAMLAAPAALLAAAALVAVLAAGGAAVPRLADAQADRTMAYELARLGPNERDPAASSVDARPPVAAGEGASGLAPDVDATWGAFVDGLEGLRTAQPEVLERALGRAETVVEWDASPIVELPRTGRLVLSTDPRFDERVAYLAGRPPAPAPPLEFDADGNLVYDPQPIEVSLSRESAEALGWAVGESRHLPSSMFVDEPSELRLSGVFEAVDPGDDYWQHRPSLLAPGVVDDGNSPPVTTAIAHLDPVGWANPVLPLRATTTVWYPLDAAAIDGSAPGGVLGALRAFTSVAQPVATGADAEPGTISTLRFRADATATIELAAERSAAASTVLAMSIAGPVGVAIAVLFLAARMLLERHRGSLRLASARGASPAQLRGFAAALGLAAGVVPAAIGAAVGLLAVPGEFAPGQLAMPAVFALAPAAMLAVLAGGVAGGRERERGDLGRRAGRARFIAEAAVLLAAAAAVLVLALRGRSPGALGVDPLLAVTPLLLAAAGCVVALRLYPLPLALLVARFRRGRGLTAFLGASRALRDPAAGLVPVLALIVGVAVAVSSGVLLTTIDRGVERAARAGVGADASVSAVALTREQTEQIAALPGVAALAGVSGGDPVTVAAAGERDTVTVYAADTAAVARVQGEGSGLLPAALRAAGGLRADAGGGADAVPVVVSASLAAALGEGGLTLDGEPARIAGVVAGTVPLGAGRWVLVDRADAAAVIGREPSNRTLLLALDAEADTAAIAASARTVLGETVRFQTPEALETGIRSSPAYAGLQAALVGTIGVAALLGAAALVMTLLLGARSRERLLAMLGTLGAPRRTAGALVAWEIGPAAVVSLLVGTALGLLLPLVSLAGVELRAFTGDSVDPAYAADLPAIALAVAAFAAVAAGCTGIALAVSRRARAAAVLRTVDGD